MAKTQALRIARIPFLNTDPFFLGWPPQSAAFLSASPRRLGQWARDGRIDAGPIPLVDYWRLEHDFEALEDFGIAVKGQARSVLLFSKKPLAELGRVGVTPQSSTSVNLLRLLLTQREGVSPGLAPFHPEDDARLLIGDEALIARSKGLPGFPITVDLAEEWFNWKKKPFVFARWVVRRAIPPFVREELRDRLTASLAAFRASPQDVAQAGAKRTGLPAEAVQKYQAIFRYRLKDEDVAGETMFRDLLSGKATRCLC